MMTPAMMSLEETLLRDARIRENTARHSLSWFNFCAEGQIHYNQSLRRSFSILPASIQVSCKNQISVRAWRLRKDSRQSSQSYRATNSSLCFACRSEEHTSE